MPAVDAATAAVIAGALGAGITGLATVGAQITTHLGTNRRERRTRLHDSLSPIYTEAYAAILDVVSEAHSGERSEPSPWSRLDALSPQIEFLGSAALTYEITVLIADASDLQDALKADGEDSPEFRDASEQLHEQVAMIRNTMRSDLGLPREGDANKVSRQVLRRRQRVDLRRRFLPRRWRRN